MILASLVGTSLEWCDFFRYGSAAVYVVAMLAVTGIALWLAPETADRPAPAAAPQGVLSGQ